MTYAGGVLLDGSASGGGSSILVGFAILISLIGLYFFPSIVASWRHHQAATVLIVNLFLGWTVVGWVVALAIAAGSSVPAAAAIAAPHLSPDGKHYWDGRSWQPMPRTKATSPRHGAVHLIEQKIMPKPEPQKHVWDWTVGDFRDWLHRHDDDTETDPEAH